MTLASYMDKNIEVEFNDGKKIDGILVRYKSKYELDDEANERLRMYADELYKIDTNMQRIFIKSTSEGDFND